MPKAVPSATPSSAKAQRKAPISGRERSPFIRYTDEPGDASKGEKLFSAIGCAQCHGLDGNRGTLDLSNFRNSQPAEIVAGIWNHSIDMQAAAGAKGVSWPQLKKAELVDLLEYIRTPVKK